MGHDVCKAPSEFLKVHEEAPEVSVIGTLLLMPLTSPLITAVAVCSNSIVPVPLASWSWSTLPCTMSVAAQRASNILRLFGGFVEWFWFIV